MLMSGRWSLSVDMWPFKLTQQRSKVARFLNLEELLEAGKDVDDLTKKGQNIVSSIPQAKIF